MPSFDVVSKIDLQEVDNAVNQAIKEIRQRYDFKGVKAEIKFRRDDKKIVLEAPDSVPARVFAELAGNIARKLAVLAQATPPIADANITWVTH